jgi:hypothetical protein
MITVKRTMVSVMALAALVLFPTPFYGQGQSGGVTNQMSATSPPVAPPLVPEGVFAVELVEALKIGQAQNEAQAEDMLSAIGIEPKNGWISGYPVTPDIVGEIEKSVTASADAKTLTMGRDEAQKAVETLSAKLDLNVIPASPSPSAQALPTGNVPIYSYMDDNGVLVYTNRYESILGEYRDQLQTIGGDAPPQPFVEPAGVVAGTPAINYAANPAPEVINNYYYNDGPPVVTYYAPPAPYYYLYVWVPYPFRYSESFFPGFFILRDFHRHVIFNRHPFVITNHVVHAVNKTVSVINPVTRAHPSSRVVGSPSVRGSAPGFSALSHGAANSVKVTTKPGFNNGAPPNSPNRTNAQNRPVQGPNVTRIEPSTNNRGTPSTTTPPTVSTSPSAEPRDLIKTANTGNQNRPNLERPAAPQPRAFNPPAPSRGSFTQAPRAQVSSPPSTTQHIGVFRTPSGAGGSSSKGFQASSGLSGRSSFSGGSFSGRR